jgi:adenylylsulfate kinase
MDSKRKSLIKTVSWRVIATSLTIGILYLFTGNLVFSGEVGIIINVVKAFAYYLHERLYAKMK